MKPRISMITLGVKDMARSIRFYEDGLGWPRMDTPPTVAFFTLNGSWLGLYGLDTLANDVGIPSNGEGFKGFTLSHNVNSQREVGSILSLAQQAGARIVKKAQTAHWGGYHGYFADPDGHLWEIAHNPFMWVGPGD